jgi:hypothetical protein
MSFARHMGIRQRGDAPSYTLCSPCYEGLALGAPNAWTCRLLGALIKGVRSGNALNHWTNIVCSPCGGGAAWRCVQLRPMLTLLRGAGSRRAQCLDTPPAWCLGESWVRKCAKSLDKYRLLAIWEWGSVEMRPATPYAHPATRGWL